MGEALHQNFEYIAAHINDYINEDKLFTTFEIDDIEKIMKFTNFTTNDFITLLKQSHPTIKANKLFTSTRNAYVTIQNYEEVINILKSLKKYLKMRVLDGTIAFLIQAEREMPNSPERIQTLQTQLKAIQSDKQKVTQKYNLSNFSLIKLMRKTMY